jgi:hypothetical protein
VLNEANLTGADLRHAKLVGVIMGVPALLGVTFTTLAHANLSNVNLTHANLDNAILTYADLAYATISIGFGNRALCEKRFDVDCGYVCADSDDLGHIVVDINVWDCQIRAFRPADQSLRIPNDDLGKMAFFSPSVPNEALNDRLNEGTRGTLRGRGLKKEEKIVDENGAINISGFYGSVEIDERDFVEDIERGGGKYTGLWLVSGAGSSTTCPASGTPTGTQLTNNTAVNLASSSWSWCLQFSSTFSSTLPAIQLTLSQ